MLKRPESAPRPANSPTLHRARQLCPYISPLYAPHGDFATLSTNCSAQTLEIINDMYTLTQVSIHQSHHNSTFNLTRRHHQIHERLLRSPSMQSSDYMHESIRLASLIYSHAILHRTTFASSANTLHQDPAMGNTTLIFTLLTAVEHTDVANCWGDMRGVFLWVCLIGGAASWGSSDPGAATVWPAMARARKCFSLWAIRAVMGVGFEFADGMMEGLRAGLRVRNLLDGRGS